MTLTLSRLRDRIRPGGGGWHGPVHWWREAGWGRRAHAAGALLWLLLLAPTVLWWRESVLWVATMSLYANAAVHAAGAARARSWVVRALHGAAVAAWAALYAPTVIWWPESVFWLAAMSLYANVGAHLAGATRTGR
jgi:hypothetical protein